MTHTSALKYLWWLVSDASGVVAVVLISLSVVLGLAMAAGAIKQPSMRRTSARLHEHLALTALAAIAVHGLALLGDHWLNPAGGGSPSRSSSATNPDSPGPASSRAISPLYSGRASTCAAGSECAAGESFTGQR